MKIYRRLGTARKAANGKPIIQVRTITNGKSQLVYLVDIDTHIEISVLTGDAGYSGFVLAGHLNRLGNANHAIAVSPQSYDAWPESELRRLARIRVVPKPAAK